MIYMYIRNRKENERMNKYKNNTKRSKVSSIVEKVRINFNFDEIVQKSKYTEHNPNNHESNTLIRGPETCSTILIINSHNIFLYVF